jgi:D-arginine dehydrogenase
MTARYDIAIVGAGIAGASLAAAIGGRASVALLEAESQPGYHSTGRSAAFWTESYGGPMVQPLTTASGPALREGGYLSKRGALTLARREGAAALAAFAAEFSALGVKVEMLDRGGLIERLPGLREDWVMGAHESDCCDIDVAGLHQHYLALARQCRAELWCRAELKRARRDACWRLRLSDGRELQCDLLVNAAGAWADTVARRAGAAPIGLTPFRRTVAQLRTAPDPPVNLPLVLDIDEQFYFKPEGGKLWLSPHDETPSAPCDAAPEELDIALAIDRFEQVVDWRVERVEHRWAGLRTFTPDRLPVFGFDPDHPGLFWCAGQGGFGIQTAPAAAALAARLLLGEGPGTVDPAPFLADRFR